MKTMFHKVVRYLSLGELLPIIGVALAALALLATNHPGTAAALVATQRYVAPGGSDAGDCSNSGSPCATIQYAVNQSAAGGTINAAAGTYPELVGVNKTLTLRGAQAGVDARSPVRTGLPATESVLTGNAGSTSFYVSASDVTIDGFTIQGNTNANQFGYGLWLGAGTSGAHVVNNIIQDNIIGLGLSNGAGSQAVIQRNLFRNNNQPGPASGTGIYTDQYVAGGAVSNVLIDSNKFTGHDDAGIDFSSTNAGSQSNITISNNEFDANGRAFFLLNVASSQIISNTISNSTGDMTADFRIYGGVTDMVITCNSITNGAGRGFRINDGFGNNPNSNITVNYNTISGNAVAGMVVDAGGHTGTLNAENNWWGAADGPSGSGPGSGDAVTGDVDFTPFLTAALCGPCPPQPNTPPTANAGPDQTVEEGTLVTLSGTGSDPTCQALTYQWTQTGGPPVTINNANTATATFTAPDAPALGCAGLTFQLTVTNPYGATGTDTVVINATDTFVLQDDRNGNCVVIRRPCNSTAGTYCWKKPDGSSVTGQCTITFTPPGTVNVQSTPGAPNLLQGLADLTRRRGNVRLSSPLSPREVRTINDTNIDNSTCTCPSGT